MYINSQIFVLLIKNKNVMKNAEVMSIYILGFSRCMQFFHSTDLSFVFLILN